MKNTKNLNDSKISMDRNRVVISLIWKFLERIGTQGIQFVVSIILARILDPSDYGVLTLIAVFINIANIFVQQGFHKALVQKKEVDETEYSSIFYISLVTSLVLYLILFFCAPLISKFYEIPNFINVLRVLSLTLFFGAVNSIQNAKVERELQFKKLLYSSLGGILISGFIGILMAYRGFGVWALVGQQLSNQITVCVIMWFTVKWRPIIAFSISKSKKLFSFGWKLLVSSLIGSLHENLQSLVIGKKYSSDMLGYFNRGRQFPQLLVDNINGTIQTVMLPVFSAEQDDRFRVKQMMRRSIVTSSFVVLPMMAGLAAIAEQLIQILLTDKWLNCVPFMQVYCFNFAFYPIHTANLQAMNAMGRSDLYLKLEIIKRLIGILLLALAVIYFDSVMAVALSYAVVAVCSSFINAFPNKRILDYSYFEQLKDIFPSVLLSFVMVCAVIFISWFNFNAFTTLGLQVVVGVVVYIGLAWLFKLETFLYLVKMVKNLLARS